MWFADVGVVASLVVLCVVLAAPLLARPAGVHWPPGRALVAVAAAALWAGHALVVDRVAQIGGPTPDDRAALALSLSNRTGVLDAAGRVLAITGGPAAMTVLASVAVMVLWSRGHRSEGVVVAVTSAGAAVLVNGLKSLYERARPPSDVQVLGLTNHALPSGHALGSLVVVGVVVVATWPYMRPRPARAVVLVGVSGFVLAVGASRVYLGAHWLTDVLAAWLIGGAWLVLGAATLVAVRRRVGQSVAARTSQVVTPPRS